MSEHQPYHSASFSCEHPSLALRRGGFEPPDGQALRTSRTCFCLRTKRSSSPTQFQMPPMTPTVAFGEQDRFSPHDKNTLPSSAEAGFEPATSLRVDGATHKTLYP